MNDLSGSRASEIRFPALSHELGKQGGSRGEALGVVSWRRLASALQQFEPREAKVQEQYGDEAGRVASCTTSTVGPAAAGSYFTPPNLRQSLLADQGTMAFCVPGLA